MDKVRAKETMNHFLVDIFNQILAIEEAWLRKEYEGDITLAEVHMLVAIGEREHGVMGDVARHAALTNGTVTTAVKKLERKGYVLRRRDEQDRRKLRVRLTESGHAAVAVHNRFHDVISDAIWTGLSDEARAPFIEGLAEAGRALTAMQEDLDP